MNRYRHDRMTSDEFADALHRSGLTVGAFMRLTGVTRWTVQKWLDPSLGREEGGDVPHWAAVFLRLLDLPEALDVAHDETNRRIRYDDDYRETEGGITRHEIHRHHKAPLDP